MNPSVDARIFLAEQRGLFETPFLRSYHTFNFGSYVAEGRDPFGALYLLNDDTLRAGASLSLIVEHPTAVVLLPVTGGLEYAVGDTTDFLEPGQTVVLSLDAGMSYRVGNSYESEFIQFLHIWLTHDDRVFVPAINPATFDLTPPNALVPLFDTGSGTRGFIGQYGGREEGTHSVQIRSGELDKRVFVLVLNGVFEVANRLLHQNDGLAMRYSQTADLEFEALSNGAMLLIIEC